jgi:hypothetical protein
VAYKLQEISREESMALVRNFELSSMERNSLHDEISAKYAVFEKDGKVLLQIDTFGRLDREMPGKKSQTIQLDRDGALKLFRIIKDAFKFD